MAHSKVMEADYARGLIDRRRAASKAKRCRATALRKASRLSTVCIKHALKSLVLLLDTNVGGNLILDAAGVRGVV
jgi:hypothetical protein